MFLQDFQIQWGEGDSDYGTCLNAVDDTMMPYAYELTPRPGAQRLADG